MLNGIFCELDEQVFKLLKSMEKIKALFCENYGWGPDL